MTRKCGINVQNWAWIIIVRRDDKNKIIIIKVLIKNAYEKGNKKWKRNKNNLALKGKAV